MRQGFHDNQGHSALDPYTGHLVHLSPEYAPERRCEQEGCITVLCRYNPGPLCWAHAEEQRDWSDLEELMIA